MSYRRPQSGSGRYPPRRPVMKKYEEKGIILEIITPELNRRRGKYGDEAILQVMGTSWFTLLEIIPEEYNTLMLQDVINIGKDERNNIKTIIGRISYDELTPVAELQVPIGIDNIMEQEELRFVAWLNKSSPVSLRLHSLQLIKGIGPKSLTKILEERKVVPFSSFEDFEERTGIGNIKGLMKQRILDEMSDPDEKHHLFTRGLRKERM